MLEEKEEVGGVQPDQQRATKLSRGRKGDADLSDAKNDSILLIAPVTTHTDTFKKLRISTALMRD